MKARISFADFCRIKFNMFLMHLSCHVSHQARITPRSNLNAIATKCQSNIHQLLQIEKVLIKNMEELNDFCIFLSKKIFYCSLANILLFCSRQRYKIGNLIWQK